MHELAESVGKSSVPPNSKSPAWNNSRHQWLLLLLFVGMAGLQLGMATRQSLWVDEIFSLAIATGHSLEHPAASAKPEWGDFIEPNQPIPASRFQEYLRHSNPPASPARVLRAVLLSDTSPPLYYLLLYFWTLVFGTNDFVLRLFSIVCWLGCFPLLANIARRIGGASTVLPACALFALSPLGLYYSGEGRMYSLLLFCVVTTAWASVVLRERGGGPAFYLVWILASAAGFLTHYFFVFPWLALVAFVALQPAKFTRKRMLLCILVVGVAVLPWYLLAFGSGAHWRVTQGWLHLRPAGFSRFRATRDDFLQFFSGGGFGLWKFRRISSLAAIGLFASVAAAFAWRFRLRMFSGDRLLLILWFAIVCAAPILIDLVQHTYFASIQRYTLSALPAAYLLAAIALSSSPGRTGLIVLVLILLSWIQPLAHVYRLRARGGEPFRAVAREVSANASPSDLILVHSIPSGVLGVARYTEGSLLMASWVQQLGTRRVPDSLLALAADRTCIRFVKVHPLGEPAPEEDWLRGNAAVSHETRFQTGITADFRPVNSRTF